MVENRIDEMIGNDQIMNGVTAERAIDQEPEFSNMKFTLNGNSGYLKDADAEFESDAE